MSHGPRQTKSRLRLLAKVVRVRKQLRDVAAAHLATANRDTHVASVACEQAEVTLDALLSDAPRKFAAAHNANTLLLFDSERRARTVRVGDSRETIAAADKKASERRAALEQQHSKLQVSEKLYEQTRRAVAKDGDRKEQKMNDDITATRTWRDS